MGLVTLVVLLEEMGRSLFPSPLLSQVMAARAIERLGSEAQKNEWLPGIANGERILTAALSELDSTDPNRPTTRAARISGGYSLSGEKTLIPAGLQAARILVSASTDDGPGLFWLTPGAKGARLEAQTSSDGQPHAYLALDGAEVSDDDVLGSVGDGTLRWLLERATVARCATQLGVTERALEMTAEYGRERVQFDVPIGSFQAFHQRAADAYIQVEGIRLTTWEAAWMLDADVDARDMVSVAKFAAADGASYSAYACQHLHGGVGIDVDYPLHRYLKWATQIEHELGSAKIQLERLGERIASGEIAAF